MKTIFFLQTDRQAYHSKGTINTVGQRLQSSAEMKDRNPDYPQTLILMDWSLAWDTPLLKYTCILIIGYDCKHLHAGFCDKLIVCRWKASYRRI